MHSVYLDNAAATKPYPVVNSAFEYINNTFYANPAAAHAAGIEAEKLLETSRKQISDYIGIRDNELIFTSGGTESINLAIRGIYNTHSKKRNQIVLSKTEHSSTYETVSQLADSSGAEITFISNDKNGLAELSSIKQILSDRTLILTILHINNESGTINPIKEITEIVKTFNQDIFIHVDAVQSFGKYELRDDLKYADLISVSAHKSHGPKGIGLLSFKKKLRLQPIFTGGGQERGLRPGTHNLPLIYAFSQSFKSGITSKSESYARMISLKERMISQLKEAIPECIINFNDFVTPYITNISFPGIRSEVLVHHLGEKGIYISAGSACSSKKRHNRVLEAFDLSPERSDSAVRISFSNLTTVAEIDTFCSETVNAVKNLRKTY